MHSSARENYLAAEVLTATPQKLHLMLVEGAIRFIRKAQQQWLADEELAASEALVRAQNIVSQLMAGLNYESGSDIVPKLSRIYHVIFQTLVDANHHHDSAELDEAVRILSVDREAWRQVCEKYPGKANADPEKRSPAPPPSPYVERGFPSADGLSSTSSFSLEV